MSAPNTSRVVCVNYEWGTLKEVIVGKIDKDNFILQNNDRQYALAGAICFAWLVWQDIGINA